MGIHWVPAFEGLRRHKECLDMAKKLTATGKYYKVRVGHGKMINGRKHSKKLLKIPYHVL